jgi:iron(III) transport system ATP-binding protein
MASVRFENITFRYGSNVILKDFSLEIDESQIMGIVGPSGCGKTTLMRCLCGFIKPEKGRIHVGDTCVFSAEKRINIAPEKRNIGVVFQDYAVWPHLTVYENIIYPMKKRNVPKQEIIKRAEYALSQVRMTGYEKHLPSQLSGGQQQRVAIARALVSSDKLIVLDEPITNLDLMLREEMLEEIRSIQRNIGTTIIYITHDQEAALKLCDRIAIMDAHGDICQVGAGEEIIYRPSNRFVFAFMGVSNFIPVVKKPDGIYINAGEDMKVNLDEPADTKENIGYVMGVRPADILFNESSPVKGKITSVTFLGNLYNYFVRLGNMEIRVQRNTLDSFQSGEYQEGEVVGLDFARAFFYEDTRGEVES